MPIPQVALDKKLIFTVTPGRSGTAYLAKLLASIPNVTAHHEPDPNFVLVMRLLQTQPIVAYNFLNQFKLPEIVKTLNNVYVETSHVTCKGFIEPMIRMGLRPSLIILRRPPREVAWSFLERKSVPCRSTEGIRYLLDPRDMGVLPYLAWDKGSNYQLCFWYALEMERRQIFYTEMAHELGMTTVDVTNKELNSWGVYSRMLTTLGLPVTDEIGRNHFAISKATHNPNEERFAPDLAELAGEEEAVWDAISHFQPLLRDRICKRYSNGLV